MNKTKLKIIKSATKLFNREGIMNVRNQDIAEEAGISLSNFNYHFKTKQDLVISVCEYMRDMLEDKVYGNKRFITDGQGLDITRAYFEFEIAFKFFYLDTNNIILNYPELKGEIVKQVNEAIQIIKNLNYMAIGRGFMKPEPPEFPGLYDRLAEQIWINNHFWLAQMHVRGKENISVAEGMKNSFALIYPYLTDKGKLAHKTYVKNKTAVAAAF